MVLPPKSDANVSKSCSQLAKGSMNMMCKAESHTTTSLIFWAFILQISDRTSSSTFFFYIFREVLSFSILRLGAEKGSKLLLKYVYRQNKKVLRGKATPQ